MCFDSNGDLAVPIIDLSKLKGSKKIKGQPKQKKTKVLRNDNKKVLIKEHEADDIMSVGHSHHHQCCVPTVSAVNESFKNHMTYHVTSTKILKAY